MPIRQITPQSKIDDYIEERMKRLKEAVIYNLCAVGEKVRNEAIENGSYTDQFGKPDGNNEGRTTGLSYARSLVGKFPKGIVLIVVAGMNYASYVSAKGYNVLDSSELLADRLVPKMLKQLGFNR